MIIYGIVYILIGFLLQTLNLFLYRHLWHTVVENKLWGTLVVNYIGAMLLWPSILVCALTLSIINFRGTR